MNAQIKSWPFYFKVACVLIIIIAGGYLAILAKPILAPLIFSVLFSLVLLPLAAFLEYQCRLKRALASLFSVLILILFIVSIGYFIESQVSKLARDWPYIERQLNRTISDLEKWISYTFHLDVAKQLQYIHNIIDKVLASGDVIITTALRSLSSLLLSVIFTYLYTFFFLVYRRLILRFLVAVFQHKNASVVYDVIEQVQFILRRYIIGLLLEMTIIISICSIAFLLLGIPYALLLGLITGLFNIVPYIGIFSALVLNTLIAFATADVAGKALLVALVIFLTHLIDSNILLPLIVGAKVRINALITILGVVIGEMVWGIAGMFLSIPVIAVLKIISNHVESLKPWGLLLGTEERNESRIARRISRRFRKS